MSRLLLACALLFAAGCALTPSGPTSLVRGTIETEGAAHVWTDGTALVVLAPTLAARLESKAPDVFALPAEYTQPLELEGRALLVRFWPLVRLSLSVDEPWPAWARGALPPEVAEGLAWAAPEP